MSHCIDCGKEIKKGNRCRSCATKESWTHPEHRRKFQKSSLLYHQSERGRINKIKAAKLSVESQKKDPEKYRVQRIEAGRAGGKIGGKRVNELHPGHASRAGKIGAATAMKLYPGLLSEIRKKAGQVFREKYSGENNPMKRPENRAKLMGKKNPMKRPEVKAKITGEKNHKFKPRIIAACDNCGELIERVQSQIKKYKHHFCSLKCFGIYNKAHNHNRSNIEILLENCLKQDKINYLAQFKYAKGIADFFIYPNFIVECDGDYWHRLDKTKKRDIEKDAYLRNAGYYILRFWESEIKADPQACAEKIKKVIARSSI